MNIINQYQKANQDHSVTQDQPAQPIVTPPTFVGLVLAGGQSSRMGCDKALLDWQGKTWLTQIANTLLKAGAQDVIISREQESKKARKQKGYMGIFKRNRHALFTHLYDDTKL